MNKMQPESDFKRVVDAAIYAFQRYADACKAAIEQPLDSGRWAHVATICDENAQAWTHLAALYRLGEQRDETNDPNRSADH